MKKTRVHFSASPFQPKIDFYIYDEKIDFRVSLTIEEAEELMKELKHAIKRAKVIKKILQKTDKELTEKIEKMVKKRGK
ncbi:MAG TPA: DUF4230 domain-containing protein [Candidatus Peregrinibacteria bacterium]|nr:DUF4230 domain-containing protein [Candidatus Peregrinibacteria bacterium]